MKVIIGQGSCGVATGAKKTAAEFEKLIAEKNLNAVVDLTGCVGTCYLEPIVDIYDDNGGHVRSCRCIVHTVPPIREIRSFLSFHYTKTHEIYQFPKLLLRKDHSASAAYDPFRCN